MSTWNLINETGVINVAAVVALVATITRAAHKRVRMIQGWWPDPFGRHEVRFWILVGLTARGSTRAAETTAAPITVAKAATTPQAVGTIEGIES